jgi:hypothetical protein
MCSSAHFNHKYTASPPVLFLWKVFALADFFFFFILFACFSSPCAYQKLALMPLFDSNYTVLLKILDK